jgi:heme/copper-type cytochrome/quinol oxidase subunit 3
VSELVAAERMRVRKALPLGWWGMAIFVASEGTLFGTLVGSYFYLRFRAVHWPPAGIAPPSLTWPLVLTGLLVATSVPMALASRAAHAGRVEGVRAPLAIALVVQAGYLAGQIHLMLDDLGRFTPQGSAYGSIYYTLLGTHHGHVFVGVVLNAWLLLRLVGGLTGYRATAVRSVAFYWHFVNVLALVVVGAQLSPRA